MSIRGKVLLFFLGVLFGIVLSSISAPAFGSPNCQTAVVVDDELADWICSAEINRTKEWNNLLAAIFTVGIIPAAAAILAATYKLTRPEKNCQSDPEKA